MGVGGGGGGAQPMLPMPQMLPMPKATTLGMPMNPLSTWWPAPIHPSLLNAIHLMAKGVVPTFDQFYAPPDNYNGPSVNANPGSPEWERGDYGTVPGPRQPPPQLGLENNGGGLLPSMMGSLAGRVPAAAPPLQPGGLLDLLGRTPAFPG